MGVKFPNLTPEESNSPVVKFFTKIDDFNDMEYEDDGYTTMEIKRSAENIASNLPVESDCTEGVTETVRKSNPSTDTSECKEATSVGNKVEGDCTEKVIEIGRNCIISTGTSESKEAKNVENKDEHKNKRRFKIYQKIRKTRKGAKPKKGESAERKLNLGLHLSSCLKTAVKNRKAKCCIRLLPYVLALIIFPLATGDDNTKSVLLTLESNPVVFDGDMRLVCTLRGGLPNRTTVTMSWQRRRSEKFEVIGIGEHPSDESKYSLQIRHSHQRLDYVVDVLNVDTVDVVSIYRCNIGFLSREENASSLAQNFVYVPKKDEVVLSTVCKNGTLKFILMIQKILPRPEKFDADFQGKQLTGSVDLTLQRKTGFYNGTVIFETTTDSVEISGLCNITYRFGNVFLPIRETCEQISEQNHENGETKDPMTLIVVVSLSIVVFLVVAVVLCFIKKRLICVYLKAARRGKIPVEERKEPVPSQEPVAQWLLLF